MNEVRVGQVWADCDYRADGREVMVLKIDGGHAICAVASKWPSRKRTRIRLNRFRPNSSGYRLVSDAPRMVPE